MADNLHFEVAIDTGELRRIASRSPQMRRKVLSSFGDRWINQARLLFTNTVKAPARVSRGGNRRTVYRSLPGFPPSIDTGTLRDSLNMIFPDDNTVELRGAEYGLYLDRDKNRPWIGKASEQAMSGLEAIWRSALP
ncbi:MAG: hypothetical protein OXE95_07915 [Chloroflexi bacterium]|nr:hypothetical protein [Chloroflexota bacterium]